MKKFLLQTTLGLSVYMVSTLLYANLAPPTFYTHHSVRTYWVERWFTLNEATTIYRLPPATAHLSAKSVINTIALQAPGYRMPCYAGRLLPKRWTCQAPQGFTREQENGVFRPLLNGADEKTSPFSLPSLIPDTPDMPSSLYRVGIDRPAFKLQL